MSEVVIACSLALILCRGRILAVIGISAAAASAQSGALSHNSIAKRRSGDRASACLIRTVPGPGQSRNPKCTRSAVGVFVAQAVRNIRVCVLGRREEFAEPGYPGALCGSKAHSHSNLAAAQFLVDQGQAEWIYTDRQTPKGKARPPLRQNAIRLVPRRTWKGKLSACGARSVRVMQLVP